ncbi:hypothetical protein Pint_14124 [Pistacia integerrima]|uniref:Uncharacterized protein n=1 Tax=Pistacia integerrima TaxID=434235 RepID=A0ACC0YB06_9ROSI|nr:hypothetical protein Pint_14124 [Pistacia integerrima]
MFQRSRLFQKTMKAKIKVGV